MKIVKNIRWWWNSRTSSEQAFYVSNTPLQTILIISFIFILKALWLYDPIGVIVLFIPGIIIWALLMTTIRWVLSRLIYLYYNDELR